MKSEKEKAETTKKNLIIILLISWCVYTVCLYPIWIFWASHTLNGDLPIEDMPSLNDGNVTITVSPASWGTHIITSAVKNITQDIAAEIRIDLNNSMYLVLNICCVCVDIFNGTESTSNPGWSFRLIAVITLTAGTAFIMWLGEQITERGIGNGISLIIFAGIVTRLPAAVAGTIDAIQRGDLKLFSLIGLLIMMALVVAAVIMMQQGTRKIPVQYAKRVVGRRIYGGQSTHIPLRVNTAGVIPVIFASSIIMFPATIAKFVNNPWMQIIADNLSPGHMLYTVIYAMMIIFFAYFYTAIVFNPTELAENMKKYGGYIPGVRPGKRTATYIDSVLTRITLAGAIFLALIAILPQILIQSLKVPFYFGGTALLIVVGVALDTMQQIESHLLTRHYEGFMKKGKLRGRR